MQVLPHPSLLSAERLSDFTLKKHGIFLFRQNAMNLRYIYSFLLKDGLKSNKMGKRHNLPVSYFST